MSCLLLLMIDAWKDDKAYSARAHRAYIYRGTIDVASIRIWLRDPVP